MALIICPECGSKISDKTEQCIHCGCPIEKNEEAMICKINGKDYLLILRQRVGKFMVRQIQRIRSVIA